MAVPKRKVSRSVKGKRSSQKFLKDISISYDLKTNESHLRHNITKSGYYKGRLVYKKKESKINKS